MSNKEREEDKKRKEADKDFGLPDIEITPIAQEEKKDMPTPIAPKQPEAPKLEEDTEAEKSPSEEKEVTEKPVHASVPPTEKEEKTPEIEKETTEQEEEEKRGKSIWWILLLLIVFLGFAFWYFSGDMGLFDRSAEEVEEPIAPIEEPAVPEVTPDPVEEEPEVPVVEEFTLTEVNAKADNPRYFVVVGSFIDGDLAKDFSDRLNAGQYSTFIIQPGYGSTFYKLAIGDYDNVVDATAMIEREQGNFEETLWVLKY